jgi:hypothetical protein
MGLFGGRISSKDSYKQDTRNPNPIFFTINKAQEIGEFVVAEVYYIGCTNYEGKKILVWQGLSVVELLDLQEIDPHFVVGSKLIARFEPTNTGWTNAISFALLSYKRQSL